MFALFYFVFEGKFQVQAPRGLEGLIHGGAYFRNFTVFEIYKAFQDRLTFLN